MEEPSTTTEPQAPAAPPLNGALTPDGGWYRWDDHWRDDRGMACGDTGTVRWGIAGPLKAFCAAVGLEVVAGEDGVVPALGRGVWHRVDQLWHVEVVLADVPRVVAGLRKAGRLALAAALDALLPMWEQAHAERVQAETEADEAEEERARQAAQAIGVHVETYRQAEHWTRALQRLARAQDRTDPDYYVRCLPVVARLLHAGVKPGQDEGDVAAWDGEAKGQRLVAWRWTMDHGFEPPERLGLDVGPGAGDVGDWRRTLPGAGEVTVKGETFAAFDGRQVLRVTRFLERRSLAAALALRLALCVDSAHDPRHDLTHLSVATRFAEIPDRAVRDFARSVARSIPLPSGLELREYQQIGVAFAARTGFRALIGDAMGVGKTPTAIACLAYGRDRMLPAVVVCPASVVHNWRREIERFAPWLQPATVEAKSDELAPSNDRRVWIVSWDLVAALANDLSYEGVQTVILDESHYAKNATALRSQAVARLARMAPHVLLLSGTAMENRTAELWHQLHIIDPNEFPSSADFVARYKNLRQRVVERRGRRGTAEVRVFADDATGDLNAELAHRLRRHMIRRLKSQVLGDLPAKVRTPLWITLPASLDGAYRKAEANLAAYLWAKAHDKALVYAMDRYRAMTNAGALPQAALVAAVQEANREIRVNPDAVGARRLMELWHLVGQAKVAPALQWVLDRRAVTEEPLVIFCHHADVVKGICKGLHKLGLRWTWIDGSVASKKERDRRIQAFQAGEYDVIVGTQAIYAGVTLTRASTMLFVERWLNPAREEQAEDRIHRFGQTSSVEIVYLMATGTVDERINALVAEKRAAVSGVMGAEEIEEAAADAEGAARLEGGALALQLAEALAARAAKVQGAQVAAGAHDGGRLLVTVEEVRARLGLPLG